MMPATLQGALAAFPEAELRPVVDADADGLIALVGEAYAEYPGCVLDLPGIDADLVSPATSADRAGTTLWVVDDGGRIVGSVGAGRVTVTIDPDAPDPGSTGPEASGPAASGLAASGPAASGPGSTETSTIELKRLYVAASHRRRGLAAGLVSLVEHHATGVGASLVDLWSDTRFGDAHRLYERLGYRRTGETRDLGDPSETTEYHFQRDLRRRPPA